MKNISIAIPTYDSNGEESKFLEEMLKTIDKQTFKNFEVCVSDHSKNDKIFEVIENFKNNFKIIYFKNNLKIGNSPANTNKAIEMCSGDIIKTMFQDDFFYDNKALEKICKIFTNNDEINWVACACNHTSDNGKSFHSNLYPKWNDQLLRGSNTIGCPSVIAFKKQSFANVMFDTNLTMLMDCEFYFNMEKKYGKPFLYQEILVTTRIHPNQISSKFYNYDNRREKIESEINYCLKKHSF